MSVGQNDRACGILHQLHYAAPLYLSRLFSNLKLGCLNGLRKFALKPAKTRSYCCKSRRASESRRLRVGID